MNVLRALGLAILVLAAPMWIVPSAAFNALEDAPRSVGASVVSDANAYLAITGGACAPPNTGGGSCAFTITNRGVETRAYRVTLLTDSTSRVQQYAITGGSTVSSGATTSGTIAVGGAATLTAYLNICPIWCSGLRTVTWKVEALSGGQALATKNSFAMTLDYG